MQIQNNESSSIQMEDFLEILDDDDSRLIVGVLKDSPKNMSKICTECNIPASTAYRKVQKLAECGILQRMGKINASGKRENWYKNNAYFTKFFHLMNC